MNKIYFLLICLTTIIQSCSAQKQKKPIFIKDFNWTITIPENFEKVNAEELAKMQDKGKESMENTVGEKIPMYAKTLFAFKSDQMHYFESNHQPFDTTVDGNYFEANRMLYGVLYETFKSQTPNAKIDTLTTVEMIDNLDFQSFKLSVNLPNDMVVNMIMFDRLFDKKQLTVTIVYADEAKGQQMLEAWRSSKFTN